MAMCTGTLIALLYKSIQLQKCYRLSVKLRVVYHVGNPAGDACSKNSYPSLPPVLHHLVVFIDGSSPGNKFFGPSILTSTI